MTSQRHRQHIDECEYDRLTKLVSSLTKLDGRRPKTTGSNGFDRSQQDETTDQRVRNTLNKLAESATWLPRGHIEIPRFEIPMDIYTLSELTPVQYLTKYCVITSRVKKLLYHRHYTKYREARTDGIDSLEKVRKALRDVCTFSVNSQSHSLTEASLNYYLYGVLNFDLTDSIKISFKNFMGMAALAERIFNPNYLASWSEVEKKLENDYQVYKKLREKEQELKERIEKREYETEVMQRTMDSYKTSDASRMTKTRFQIVNSIDSTEQPDQNQTEGQELEISVSEEELYKQIEEKKTTLENKISITKLLELESRPNRCPKEIMEQVDFHALKWRLEGVVLSPAMQRLIRIIVSL